MIEQYLEKLGINELNTMQKAALEAATRHQNVILLSPTGSGKTLAFLLPLIKRLDPEKENVQALVISPTRELALQIEQVWKSMGTGMKVSTFYGGHHYKTEINSLQHPPAVLIGTPGRLLDHITKGNLDGSSIKSLVLDEFDKSLELGFEAEVSALIKHLTGIHKVLLSSATNLNKLPEVLVNREFYKLDFLTTKENVRLRQKLVKAEGEDKLEALFNLICKLGDSQSLVFCNHREAVERISELLAQKGLPHSIYHGKLEQEDRELALVKFRNGSSSVLIATDLAARGLDIPEIQNVIHYQLPKSEEAFIHRNGRTARMHASGVSYLVVAQREPLPKFINKKTEVETIGESSVLPVLPAKATLRLNAGKQEKISKTDVVGLLIKKGGLSSPEVGLIEVKDRNTFVAVPAAKVNKLLANLKDERIKKTKIKLVLV